MNASGAWGVTVAVPIRRESYEIEHDAQGTAYAFSMDESTVERLTGLLEAGAGRPEATVRPGYLRVDATPDLRTPPGEYQDAIPAAVRKYNDQYATHSGEELQLDTNNAYVGVSRPENAHPLSAFVDRLDMEEYQDKRGFVESGEEPLFTWERDDPREDTAGGDSRHVAFEVVVQIAPETYAAPGGMSKPSDTFRWRPESDDVRDPVEYLKHPRASRILGRWGSCMDASLWPTHATVTVHTGSTVTTPQGIAKQARRRLNTLTPNAVQFKKRARVLPLEPSDGDKFEAWAARETPDVDGEPIEATPEEPEEHADDSSGGLLSWRP